MTEGMPPREQILLFPEILDGILFFLDSSDLLQTCRVCQVWAERSVPLIWRYLEFRLDREGLEKCYLWSRLLSPSTSEKSVKPSKWVELGQRCVVSVTFKFLGQGLMRQGLSELVRSIVGALGKLTNLTRLTLDSLAIVDRTPFNRFLLVHLANLDQPLPKLEQLVVSMGEPVNRLSDFHVALLKFIWEQRASLRELDMSRAWSIKASTLALTLSRLPFLRVLKVAPILPLDGVLVEFDDWQLLERLELKLMDYREDQLSLLLAFLNKFPRLIRLELWVRSSLLKKQANLLPRLAALPLAKQLKELTYHGQGDDPPPPPPPPTTEPPPVAAAVSSTNERATGGGNGEEDSENIFIWEPLSEVLFPSLTKLQIRFPRSDTHKLPVEWSRMCLARIPSQLRVLECWLADLMMLEALLERLALLESFTLTMQFPPHALERRCERLFSALPSQLSELKVHFFQARWNISSLTQLTQFLTVCPRLQLLRLQNVIFAPKVRDALLEAKLLFGRKPERKFKLNRTQLIKLARLQ